MLEQSHSNQAGGGKDARGKGPQSHNSALMGLVRQVGSGHKFTGAMDQEGNPEHMAAVALQHSPGTSSSVYVQFRYSKGTMSGLRHGSVGKRPELPGDRNHRFS